MNSAHFDILRDHRYLRHAQLVQKYLPYIGKYGYYAINSVVLDGVAIGKDRLRDTMLNPEKKYSETMNLATSTDAHQYGYSKRYEVPRAPEDNKTAEMVTCYMDGYIVSDGYLDIFMENNNGLNPNWFMYQVQRHLQLTKEVLTGLVDEVLCIVMFKGIERFEWELYRMHHRSGKMAYTGYHHNIERKISLSDINGRDKWNIKMDVVEDILTEVARIFGFDKLPQKYWEDETNEILYAKGFSGR
jgi:hypothetical protein